MTGVAFIRYGGLHGFRDADGCPIRHGSRISRLPVTPVALVLACLLGPFAQVGLNGAGGRERQDVFDYLAAWFAGCP